MHLVSVQVGHAQTIQLGERRVETGIDKRSVPSAHVTKVGVVGDEISDTRHHGGPDQALYVYSVEDHQWWLDELGRPIRPGEFGENLTLSSFGHGDPRVGDRYRIGAQLILELSAPRIPCAVLGAQMGDGRFAERFRRAGRPGGYARVVAEGSVAPGDPVERIGRAQGAPTLAELVELHYDRAAPREALLRALAAPVAERARREYEQRLSGLD